LCKLWGITANVIGIRGDNLNFNVIGKLADITQGDTDVVDPLKIVENFSSIVDSKLVATNVVVKLFLDKVFQFPKDDNWTTPDPVGELLQLHATRNFGNAFEDTEVTVEFLQKEDAELLKVLDLINEDPNVKNFSPFQVQITYTSLTGLKCLRVITKTREVTRSVEEAQEDIDVAVFGMHANIKQASLAKKGMLSEALEHDANVNELMLKNLSSEVEVAGYSAYRSSSDSWIKDVERVQQQQQQLQPMADLGTVRMQQQQLMENDDEMSNRTYQHRNTKSNKKMWSGASRKY